MEIIKEIDFKDFRDQRSLEVLKKTIGYDSMKAKECHDAQWVIFDYRDNEHGFDVELTYYIEGTYSEIEINISSIGRGEALEKKENVDITRESVENLLDWAYFEAM